MRLSSIRMTREIVSLRLGGGEAEVALDGT